MFQVYNVVIWYLYILRNHDHNKKNILLKGMFIRVACTQEYNTKS